ncbi:MAG: TIGR03084 family metal-binding protein [Pseudomonadota bacterium]
MSQDPKTSLLAVVADLKEEGDGLYQLLKDQDTGIWTQVSSFKSWTVWDVVAHLHFSDYMALTSLSSGAAFKSLMKEIAEVRSARKYTDQWLSEDGHSITGPALLERWRNTFKDLCDALEAADPNERFVWVGPGMKARMFATARQMETWAHGWEVYDLLGLQRSHTDRIRNIATIGVRTYGWTFANRKLEVPQPEPYIELAAPSGDTWSFNDPASEHRVVGNAVEFCQVVTQVRNIADTQLQVSGDNAEAWMAVAQCFAGPPEDPPLPGSRT